jgi:hypothetical protein
MSASTIHDLLSSLEQTIHERFRIITQLLSSQMKAPEPPIMGELLLRIQALEKRLEEVTRQGPQELLPTSPMVGLEVFRKQAPVEKVVVLTPPVVTDTLAVETQVELNMENTSVIESEAEAEPEPEPEPEAEEEEAVELEEFEYKGATYYRDSDNNVFTTDEDGELNAEPFGLWNEAKQRIVARP